MRRSLLKRVLGVALVVAATAQLALLNANAAQADVIAAGGSDTTMDVMTALLQGTGAINIKVKKFQTTDLLVPSDANCNAVTWRGQADAVPSGQTNGGKVQPPSGSGEGRNAVTGSVAKTYPTVQVAPAEPANYYVGVSGNGGCVDIARSSSFSATTNGEFYGFGLDVTGWASPSLLAPPSLTLQQLRDIYLCNYNNWNQVGGGDGEIIRVFPAFGSGMRESFIRNVLGRSAAEENPSGGIGYNPPNTGTIPAGAPGAGTSITCKPTMGGGTDITAPEENNGKELLTPARRADLQKYIIPYSDGKWVYHGNNSGNPSLDLRAGLRPGGLVNTAAAPGAAPAWPVRWVGSSWRLNDATILDGATGTHTVASVTAGAAFDTTLDSGVPGTFTAADIGRSIRGNTYITDGTVITGVDPTGAIATINPGSKSTSACACSYPQTSSIVVGYAIVSEKNPQVTSGSNFEYAGVRIVWNMLVTTSPSYLEARGIVGFSNTAGGAISDVCNGNKEGLISDGGFLPLPLLDPDPSSGNQSPVSCRLRIT